MTENPAVWIDGDPLMEAIAEAAWDRCERGGNSTVFDDPRNIAAAVAQAARAIVLREAADIAESLREFKPAFGPRKSAQISENVGILRVADQLREIADAAAPAPTVR